MLSGLAQTSVLSVGSDRIARERLQLVFAEESTSASILLLSSVAGARRQFVRDGDELLGRAVRSAHLRPNVRRRRLTNVWARTWQRAGSAGGPLE
jgi:hypothetical protein